MKTERFVKRSRIGAGAEDVFAWHLRPDSLERLIPPWERARVVERTGSIGDGGRVVFQIEIGPFARRWVSAHRDFVDGRQFRDVQVSGPFAFWEHLHLVEPDGATACWLEDRIEYALPLGGLGRLVAGAWTRRRLERLFEYRHEVTAREVLVRRSGT